MAVVVHIFLTLRPVWKQFQVLCNNTVVWILVSSTTSIDSGMHKVVTTLDESVVNETIRFHATQLQAKQ